MKKYIINLKSTARTIHSKAELDKKTKIRLYWFLEPGPKNSPLKYVQAGDRGGFGEAGVMKFSMNTDENGVCEHDEFRMSACGLDKFKVSVGSKKDGSDKKTNEEYEVWRQVFYSVRYMDPKFLFTFGPVSSEYHKHGVWPEQVAAGGGSARVSYDEIIQKYEEGYASIQPVTQDRLEARILLVDRIWLSYKREFIVKTTKRAFRVTSFPQTSNPDTTVQSSWILWPRGQFATGKVGGVGIGNYDFTPNITRLGDRELRVSIPDGTPTATALDEAAGRGKLVYRFSVWFAKVLNGFANSGSGKIVVAYRTRDNAAREVSPRQGTMIHEMGHGLGMVPSTIQEYNEFNGNPIKSGLKKNPTQYQNGGGHCSTAAGGSDPNYVDGTCVMFHYGHDGRSLEFCGSCAPLLKRKNMNRDDMLWPTRSSGG